MTFLCFFFSSRRRHTRLQGDWSSDVCSSDLARMMRKISLTLLGAASGVALTLLATQPRVLQLGMSAKAAAADRSEERRVGKECRSRWAGCNVETRRW